MKSIEKKLLEVESSIVRRVGYNADTKDLTVEYRVGGTYVYHGVPDVDYQALRMSPSVGSFMRKEIQPKYRHTRQ